MVLSSAIVCNRDRRIADDRRSSFHMIADDRRPFCDLRSAIIWKPALSCDLKLISCNRKLLSCDEKNRCVPYEPPLQILVVKIIHCHFLSYITMNFEISMSNPK